MAANPEIPERCDCARCVAHDSGVQGPYTPADFLNVFGVVNPTVDRPEPSDALLEAGRRMDEALAAFENADQAWQAAVMASRRGQGNSRTRPAEQERLDGDVSEARRYRDDAADELQRARAAYNRLAQRELDRRAMDEYAETVAAQEAAAEARRKATEKGALARIRDRITRS